MLSLTFNVAAQTKRSRIGKNNSYLYIGNLSSYLQRGRGFLLRAALTNSISRESLGSKPGSGASVIPWSALGTLGGAMMIVLGITGVMYHPEGGSTPQLHAYSGLAVVRSCPRTQGLFNLNRGRLGLASFVV